MVGRQIARAQLPNKRLLQAADSDRFRFDARPSPALFPHGGSGPIISALVFDAAAEAQVVGLTSCCNQRCKLRTFGGSNAHQG